MKRTIILAAILGLGLAPAARAEQGMTVGKCLQVYGALSALDGYQKVVADKPTTIPYKFSGTVRFTIAQAITTLRPFSDSAEKTRVQLVTDIGGGKTIEAGSPELGRLTTEYLKVLDAPCGVQFVKIALSDLRLGDDEGQNPIPPGVLSLLMPIIDPNK